MKDRWIKRLKALEVEFVLEGDDCLLVKDQKPQRARLKIWQPKGQSTAFFFYKPSNLSWSRDRFSYGGALVGGAIEDDRLDGWIAYLQSGFHPEKRPADLKKVLPFDVPL